MGFSERYQLAAERIEAVLREETVQERYRPYFYRTADFLLLLHTLEGEMKRGVYAELSLEKLREWNDKLYWDILPDNYEESYANPTYAVRMLGGEYGGLLSFLYAELRGGITYVFERRGDFLTILFELFLQVYRAFEEEREPKQRTVKDILYWYASDYCDVFLADRVEEKINPRYDFAAKLICTSDFCDLRYLYRFGEYISKNEIETARHLMELPAETIIQMAEVYTEGYRRGFINTGKNLSIKSTVNIQYALGFEPVVKRAIENFGKMGLKPVIYRAAASVLTRGRKGKDGYFGGSPNKQYEYDHRNDQAFLLDKRLVLRKLEVMRNTYEKNKTLARGFAGPAVIETFGETPFSPILKKEAAKLNERQEELALFFESRAGQITNEYIRGEERSFTIIAYPVVSIGSKYKEIFREVIKINTLDAEVYGRVQKVLIDALDKGKTVHILGKGNNRTDMTVRLYNLQDAQRETIFENCVADVNIPVGEVFTSPVLEGTRGRLHVSKVYLNGLLYKDLELTFEEGRITDYSCGNFREREDGKRYIRDNLLQGRESLPLGEFAIGTNTTAYAAAKKYGIEEKLPILIAEKMGPHFAVGDTCYSFSEDIKVYNPDGKEIVARDNSVSILRKEDIGKAYFHCHTDITIPYEELGLIEVVTDDGERIPLIREGKFVLPGTEFLNEPLKSLNN